MLGSAWWLGYVALVDTLIAKTRAWEEDRGISFIYDGVPLLAMLDEYTMLRHEREEEKRRLRVNCFKPLFFIYELIHVTFGLMGCFLKQTPSFLSLMAIYGGLCRTIKNSMSSNPQTKRSSPIQGLALLDPLVQRRQRDLVRMELQTEHLAADGYHLTKMDLDQWIKMEKGTVWDQWHLWNMMQSRKKTLPPTFQVPNLFHLHHENRREVLIIGLYNTICNICSCYCSGHVSQNNES